MIFAVFIALSAISFTVIDPDGISMVWPTFRNDVVMAMAGVSSPILILLNSPPIIIADEIMALSLVIFPYTLAADI